MKRDREWGDIWRERVRGRMKRDREWGDIWREIESEGTYEER